MRLNNTLFYFDFAASTPCDNEVIKSMSPYFNHFAGNPSNSQSAFAKSILSDINKVRFKVSRELGCLPQEIFWTSGATESNNICIQGFLKNVDGISHIITSTIEHKSVLYPIKELEKRNDVFVSYIEPNKNGSIDVDKVLDLVNRNTRLISIMAANNETGVINEIGQISESVKNIRNDIIFHSDCTQIISEEKINVKQLGIDMITFSGHKIYGPKGIGVLYKSKNVNLSPITHGGGQENGLRSGTLNVPGIIGIGKAFNLFKKNYRKDNILSVRIYFERKLNELFAGDIVINGKNSNRTSHITNVTFTNLREIIKLDEFSGFVLSSGSACDTNDLRPSYVLRNMGVSIQNIKNTIRVSFGKRTTNYDVDHLLDELVKFIKKYK